MKQEKDKKVRYLSIKLPADVDDALRKIAEEQTRTLAAQVLHYLKKGIENESHQ